MTTVSRAVSAALIAGTTTLPVACGGSYELWCSVDRHKDQGMDLTIQVG